MLIEPTHLIVILLFLAFWITILWCAITLVKSFQRIANSLEEIANQGEERLKN